MFLVNSRLGLVCDTTSGFGREVLHPTVVLLLPKLRRQFAEFLNQGSLDRLSILYLPTCVGLGYGHLNHSLEAFLGSVGPVASPETARHRASGLRPPGFAWGIPLRTYPTTTIAWVDLPSCVPPSLP